MFSRPARFVTLILLCSASLVAQQNAPSPRTGAGAVMEFPVVMQQAITAGRTAVGTKVTARLVVATLVEGVVVPRGTTFSGEVTESAAKSAAEPSRLSIRMDEVQWKGASAPIKVYLTAWYYPVQFENGQRLQYTPPDPSGKRDWNGAGTYPDPNSPASQPFPGRDSSKASDSLPDTPATVTSKRRILMNNVESARGNDGAVSITSKRSNIKLDKLTTYVLAAADLLPPK
jgi:hypothetical protein